MSKHNIYILNYWWAANYGAILTAYALQETILNYNENVYCAKNTDNIQLLTESRYNFHEIFTSKYIQQKEITTSTNDIYIVGSDQVFRPILNKRIADTFLLDFADINSKKIAFSASFGISKEKFLKENSQLVIEKIKNALKTFDFVSIREKIGVEICKDILGVSAEWIIDPVFILEKSKYESLIQNSTKDYSNKIVGYLINQQNRLNKYNREKIIQLADSNETVENWLSAIKNCKLLITDSFHGMCFALIFNKPFICVVNPHAGSARYDSVFELLGIENQCIENINQIYKKDCIFKVDYGVVNKRIEEECQKGLDFLKMALEAPVQVTQEKFDSRVKFLENKVCELEQQTNLKYQIKKELWNLWLIIFHKYMPEPVKKMIRFVRDRLCK